MMSPEPTQEPAEENLNSHNLNIGAIAANESDSEDEDVGMGGYMPLSQVPIDSDPMLEDEEEDDDWISVQSGTNYMSPSISSNETQESHTETIQVWSSPCTQSDIDLDADKINQVKTAMASFTLPTTAIPEWAIAITEVQWKQQLIDRIKEMQSKD